MKILRNTKNFILEAFAEFRKVQWPTKKQTLCLTGFVIGVSLVVGIYVSVLDLGFTNLLAVVFK